MTCGIVLYDLGNVRIVMPFSAQIRQLKAGSLSRVKGPEILEPPVALRVALF